MAQKTWNAGDVLTSTDMNTYASHEGGSFTGWNPAVTQSGSVTVTTTEGSYARSGRLIQFTAVLTVTGSGSGSNNVSITLPVATKAAYTTASVLGFAILFDTSAATRYFGPIIWATSTTFNIRDMGNGNIMGNAGATFSAGLAINDVISFEGFYEAAS